MFRALSWSHCLGLAFLYQPLGAQPAGAGESRTALVIGNSAYPESPLRNTLNDARGMAQVLRESRARNRARSRWWPPVPPGDSRLYEVSGNQLYVIQR
ncbi:MAG: caspase family protein [Holophaga sp.]|jgi:hypothetical protein